MYQSNSSFPYNIAKKIPIDKYGPKANILSFFIVSISVTWIIEPNIHPTNNAIIIFCHPIRSPAVAISLISPPPMPLPAVNRNNKNKNKRTYKKEHRIIKILYYFKSGYFITEGADR